MPGSMAGHYTGARFASVGMNSQACTQGDWHDEEPLGDLLGDLVGRRCRFFRPATSFLLGRIECLGWSTAAHSPGAVFADIGVVAWPPRRSDRTRSYAGAVGSPWWQLGNECVEREEGGRESGVQSARSSSCAARGCAGMWSSAFQMHPGRGDRPTAPPVQLRVERDSGPLFCS